jgi:hypothetical protein
MRPARIPNQTRDTQAGTTAADGQRSRANEVDIEQTFD